MKYRFILTYQATDGDKIATRTCFPLHGDDLSISIDRAEGEWYYTRNLDGKLVFTGDDYTWIMGQAFDGTFTLNIKESHDNGATFYDYFSGTFSRASLEIDQDNHTATLNGLKEGVEDLIKNGAKEEYDLMKLIPDSEAKTVQGQVPPALALYDECSAYLKPSFSDIYCNAPIIGGGYISEVPLYYAADKDMRDDTYGTLQIIWAEAKLTMKSNNYFPLAAGHYTGALAYRTNVIHGIPQRPDVDFYFVSIDGTLSKENNAFNIRLVFENDHVITEQGVQYFREVGMYAQLITSYNSQEIARTNRIHIGNSEHDEVNPPTYSPITLQFQGTTDYGIDSLSINIHYVYASILLANDVNGTTTINFLDTSKYYERSKKGPTAGWLGIYPSVRTVERPNGHRMVPGSDTPTSIPQYFAPPFDGASFIPLSEKNWNYASLWYLDPGPTFQNLFTSEYFGSFPWSRCWTIGNCIRHLLDRITNNEVIFAETTDYSQFLYGNPNPVEGHEPFQWLVTQKSNVMRPAAGGAARCPVRLDWFFELLRNTFNCYYWFEKRDDGRYDFRIEHIEYFRRGGAYNGDLADQLDLTRLKPHRNFLRNGQPAKRYADQTNKYTFDLDGMVEKYTYSWQGDGGSDDFKGNPMYFKAGWIEKGTSEDRQVDNIFADLGWLMLNAGTATESSKNYDGLFIFGGYNPYGATTWMYPSASGSWKENSEAQGQYLVLATATSFNIACDIWLTVPTGEMVIVKYERVENPISIPVQSLVGTGHPQQISINERRSFNTDHRLMVQFPNDYSNVTIHRIHASSGNVFNVPNVADLLRPTNYLQNGVLAWPWLQCEYLHYDIPATKWTYKKDEYTDNPDLVWESDGTIKMVKKQTLGVVPVPDASTEDDIMGIMGVKTGLGTGIIDNAKINLSSRNAEMTIIYDINPNNN